MLKIFEFSEHVENETALKEMIDQSIQKGMESACASRATSRVRTNIVKMKFTR